MALAIIRMNSSLLCKDLVGRCFTYDIIVYTLRANAFCNNHAINVTKQLMKLMTAT